MNPEDVRKLYAEKHGHLIAPVFPYPEDDYQWNSGMSSIEYLSSHLFVKMCEQDPTLWRDADLDDISFMSRNAIGAAEIFLNELAARGKERWEECEREVEAKQSEGNADPLSEIIWDDWIRVLQTMQNRNDKNTRLRQALEYGQVEPNKDLCDLCERILTDELHYKNFSWVSLYSKNNRNNYPRSGIALKFGGHTYAELYARKPDEDDIKYCSHVTERILDPEQYILYAMVDSGSTFYQWIRWEPVEDPVESLQEHLCDFYQIGFDLSDHTGQSNPTPF